MAPHRREFLELALGGALAAAGSRAAIDAAFAEPLAQPVPFAADTVLKAAMMLAASPYKAPESPLPSQFSGLSFEQYAAIRRAPGSAIWANEKLDFSLEPLHRGFVYTTPIAINIVENGQSQRLIYDPADYDFGKLQPPASAGDLGFSGLRILAASDQGFQDAAIFQGASFYRSRARGQNFGVTARGLAIRTGDDPGEEFPLFREFWVEKPAPAANTLTVHALLNSQSVTGAFRFTIRPLETTIIDTEMTLIARVATDKLGIGAMAAAYLFSPLDHRRTDDWRAAVYEVTGLQMLSGAGEWLWRPVANRETLQISAFADVNPRGFGLTQRSRTFDAFYDDEGRWELRPTLWIEPIGDWSAGDMRLLEIPVTTENNANILAQWRRRRGSPPAARFRSPTDSSGAGLPVEAATGHLHLEPGGKGRRQTPLRRGDDRGCVRRSAESRGGGRGPAREPRQDRIGQALSLQRAAFGAGAIRSRSRLGRLFRIAADA